MITRAFQSMTNEHILLLYDGSNHWLLSSCSNGGVQICDSLRDTLSQVSQTCVNSLYREYIGGRGKIKISFLPVSKQPDSYNCGLFAIAFGAEMLDGKSPVNARFDVDKMRPHLIQCLDIFIMYHEP